MRLVIKVKAKTRTHWRTGIHPELLQYDASPHRADLQLQTGSLQKWDSAKSYFGSVYFDAISHYSLRIGGFKTTIPWHCEQIEYDRPLLEAIWRRSYLHAWEIPVGIKILGKTPLHLELSLHVDPVGH